jgi:hypothetical protein
MFPFAVAILPLYILLRGLGLLDNPFGVILPQVAFGLPVTITILRGFFRTIPADVEEVALLDGRTALGFFWHILLPMARPALAMVSVLAIVASWNNFLLPPVVFNDATWWTLRLGVTVPGAVRRRHRAHPGVRRARDAARPRLVRRGSTPAHRRAHVRRDEGLSALPACARGASTRVGRSSRKHAGVGRRGRRQLDARQIGAGIGWHAGELERDVAQDPVDVVGSDRRQPRCGRRHRSRTNTLHDRRPLWITGQDEALRAQQGEVVDGPHAARHARQLRTVATAAIGCEHTLALGFIECLWAGPRRARILRVSAARLRRRRHWGGR